MRHTGLLVLLLSGTLLAEPSVVAPVPQLQQGVPTQPRPRPELPEVIPLFPLPDVVLFPDMATPLNVFEPRYREMVADAMKGDGIIGMVVLQAGFESDYQGRPPIYPIGTAGEIVDIEQLPDGRFHITLQAITKFRVTSEDQSRAYRVARVQAVPETQGLGDVPLIPERRQRLTDALRAFADQPDVEIPTSIPETELVNTLSRRLPLQPSERQLLLEQDGIDARFEKLIELLGTKSNQRR